MKYEQHSSNWNERFKKNDVPWEDTGPWSGLVDVLKQYVEPGSTVLDTGCGFGVNTIEIAKHGYHTTGVDISQHAIKSAKERAHQQGVECCFEVSDFLNYSGVRRFDCVFDRGLLHTFCDQSGRKQFARKVASQLATNGVWINVSGNSDNPDDPADVKKHNYPRITATELVGIVEPLFEIKELRSCMYGSIQGLTDFRAWLGVFQKRD